MKRKRSKPATGPGPGPGQTKPAPAEHARRRPDGPQLSDHDLRQMDSAWQQHQTDETVRGLLARALDDLRLARDRLNQSPDNSSRPSGSMAPWQRGGATVDDGAPGDELGDHEPSAVEPAREGQRPDQPPGDATHPSEPPDTAQPSGAAQPGAPDSGGSEGVARCEAAAPAQQALAPAKLPARPGRRVGAPGFGRQQRLIPTCSQEHRPSCCAACLAALDGVAPLQAWTGWDTLELVALRPSDQATPPTPVVLGARIEVTRHLLMQRKRSANHILAP